MSQRQADDDHMTVRAHQRALANALAENGPPRPRMLSNKELDIEFKRNAKELIKSDAKKGIFHEPEDEENRLRAAGYPKEADRRAAERKAKRR